MEPISAEEGSGGRRFLRLGWHNLRRTFRSSASRSRSGSLVILIPNPGNSENKHLCENEALDGSIDVKNDYLLQIIYWLTCVFNCLHCQCQKLGSYFINNTMLPINKLPKIGGNISLSMVIIYINIFSIKGFIQQFCAIHFI